MAARAVTPRDLPTLRELPVVRGLTLALVLGALGVVSPPELQAAGPVPVEVKVVHAHNRSTVVDPRVAALVKDLRPQLKFTGFDLKDSATFSLERNSVGRMKLPSGAWLTLTPLDFGDDKLRLELEVKELKFKTTVSLARGATLAIGGPPYDGGALILAISRREP
jgi:hypothetical protein